MSTGPSTSTTDTTGAIGSMTHMMGIGLLGKSHLPGALLSCDCCPRSWSLGAGRGGGRGGRGRVVIM